MKNFSDLLATESWIDIEVETDQGTIASRWNLLTPLDLNYPSPTSVRVDGMEILKFGYQQNGIWRIKHNESFYRWRHRITGQGWLLEPVKSLRPGSNGI